MIKVIILGFGVAVGGFAVVFGEADDSPGLQGLGVILSLFCMYKIYQKFQRVLLYLFSIKNLERESK